VWPYIPNCALLTVNNLFDLGCHGFGRKPEGPVMALIRISITSDASLVTDIPMTFDVLEKGAYPKSI
jgi:hypothetical protein